MKMRKRQAGASAIARNILIALSLVVFVLICALGYVGKEAIHIARTPGRGLVSGLVNIEQMIGDPRAGFPGKDQLNVLCMGIDDNWTDSDVVYTRNARTDTLFLLTLNLVAKKAAMLSIQRDSYVPIVGTDRSDKINAAYASGGPWRSVATVSQLLGVQPDYYVVLNIDATKKLVDAIGGVDVNVEHEMNYDDNWGHLHVHLLPGLQHLNGDQAVSFARYRHGNHGLATEDGDERRIYRQHVLLRAMIDRVKTFSNIMQADTLVDTAMTCVHTNLTRSQLLDLGALFHSMSQSDMITASLPAVPFTGPGGASDVKLDDAATALYVDWLVHGDMRAARALTPVVIRNASHSSAVADQAEDRLRTSGYENIELRGASREASAAVTQITDTGVSFATAPHDVATILELSAPQVSVIPVEPTRGGWTPPAEIDITLGQDFAAQAAHGPLSGR
jgi:LCP family protein required for cell wall assembly